MNRRDFVKSLTGAGAAIAAIPLMAKNPGLPKGINALPKNPVVGDFRVIVCAEDGKWIVMADPLSPAHEVDIHRR